MKKIKNNNFNLDLYIYELKRCINDNAKFKIWIETLKMEYDDNTTALKIYLPNYLFKNKIKFYFENYFYQAAQITKYKLDSIEYIIDVNFYDEKIKYKNNHTVKPFTLPFDREINIDPKFDLNNFIIDNTNTIAYKFAMEVVNNPGGILNPFYLCGTQGSGKSHLIQGMAKYIKHLFPHLSICYISSLKLKKKYLKALKDNNFISFREKYRKFDVFILDDGEELASMEKVQEEFFHIFNTLIHFKSQIIIASRFYPQQLKQLQPRLRNRFENGLVIEIEEPSEELLLEFIKQNLSKFDMFLPEDIIIYFLKKINTKNIGTLETYLNKLISYMSVTQKNIVSVKDLNNMLKKIEKYSFLLTIETIKKEVAKYFNINYEDLSSKNRKKNAILPKYIAMYLSRELTDFSVKRISYDFGYTSRSVVNSSCTKIKKNIETDENLGEDIKNLTKILNRG